MRNLALYCSTLALFVLTSSAAIAQSLKTGSTEATPAEKTTYYAYAHVVVDNGTLLITDLKKIELPKAKNEKEERQTILAYRSSNNLNFFKKVGAMYGQLMEKTIIPSSYNSIIMSANKEEIEESRNLWLSKKDKNTIFITDFEFSNPTESNTSALKKIIIE